MSQIDLILSGISSGPPSPPESLEPRPRRRLAVLTCMDTRLEVESILGLRSGDAHILRNAGARLTEDVVRSLALSSHVLGTDTVVVMQHTRCGLTGVTDEYLRRVTGADFEFHAIDDHEDSLRRDIERIARTPFLSSIEAIAGLLYDIDGGDVALVVRWDRSREQP